MAQKKFMMPTECTKTAMVVLRLWKEEECLSCPALAVCDGSCPYDAMLKYGSIWNIDRRFCIHSKEALEWLIWDLYDKVLERLS